MREKKNNQSLFKHLMHKPVTLNIHHQQRMKLQTAVTGLLSKLSTDSTYGHNFDSANNSRRSKHTSSVHELDIDGLNENAAQSPITAKKKISAIEVLSNYAELKVDVADKDGHKTGCTAFID